MRLSFKSQSYFNRDIIKYNWKRINNTPLKFAGLRVRAAAIRSIKTVRGKKRETYSPPGSPPYSRDPRRPFKRIYSIPDTRRGRTYVGMVFWNQTSGSIINPVPGRHEHGGYAYVTTVVRTPRIKTGRKFNKSQRAHINAYYQQNPRNRGTKRVLRRRVHLEPRPFMVPALERVRATLPALWHMSVNLRR